MGLQAFNKVVRPTVSNWNGIAIAATKTISGNEGLKNEMLEPCMLKIQVGSKVGYKLASGQMKPHIRSLKR